MCREGGGGGGGEPGGTVGAGVWGVNLEEPPFRWAKGRFLQEDPTRWALPVYPVFEDENSKASDEKAVKRKIE